MPRVIDIKNSFVTGEISPFVLGRTDLVKYSHACEKLSNFIVRPEGGISRRPGFRFIHSVPRAPGRLIPFIFDSTHSYVLLISSSQHKIYFFTKDAPIFIPFTTDLYSIDSPYTELDDLEELKFAQIADTMYLVHPNHPVQKLNRLSDTNWVLIQPAFHSPPATQQDEDISGGTLYGTFAVNIASGPIDIDNFVTVPGTGLANITASSYIFQTTDLGKNITAGTGIAKITGFNGPGMPIKNFFGTIIGYKYNSVIVDISVSFDLMSYANWNLGITPETSPITIIKAHLGDLEIVFSSPIIMKGDIGRQVVAGTGVAIITDVDLGGVTQTFTWADGHVTTFYQGVIVTIIDQFDNTNYPSGSWRLRGSPNSFFSPGTWDSGTMDWTSSTLFGLGSVVPVQATTQHPTDKSFAVTYTGGFTDTFRVSDKGRFVSFSGGYAQIKDVIDSTSITITILATPTTTETDAHGNLDIASAFPGSWFYEDLAFTDVDGFPRAVCFFQARLWFAGTSANPQTIWASNTDDFENFAKSTLDDAGIEIEVSSGNFDSILWLQPYLGNIVVGTFRGEYVLGAGSTVLGQSSTPITPTNASATFQSSYGVTAIQPLIVQEALFYVQRSQVNVYEMEFNIQNALYTSKDMNILNNLVAKLPIIEMVYHQNPFKIIWFLSGVSGQGANLIGLTFDKTEGIFAWHRHFTGDGGPNIISMCTIPNIVNGAIVDELWIMTARPKGVDTLFSIELMDISLNMDFASHYVGILASSITGLDYLEQQGIVAVGDGTLLPSILLVSNTYNLPPDFLAKDIQVGLNYISEVLTVRPELKSGGTSQGLLKRWNRIWIRIYNSLGITINNQFVPNRTNTNNLGQGVPLFTGDEDITNLGYDRDGRINIMQQYPLPANILALFGQLLIGEN